MQQHRPGGAATAVEPGRTEGRLAADLCHGARATQPGQSLPAKLQASHLRWLTVPGKESELRAGESGAECVAEPL